MKRIPRSIWILVAIGVLLRLGSFAWVASHAGEGAIISGDGQTYAEVARNLAAGNGFMIEENGKLIPEVFRAPGESLLLAPFLFFPYGYIWWGIFLSIVAGVLLPVLVYCIGKRIGNEQAAIIAATLVTLEPHLVWFSWTAMSEMPATLLLLGALALAIHSWGKNPWLGVGGVGLLLGAAVLVRPPFLPIALAVLTAVGIWFAIRRRLKYCLYAVVVGVVLLSTTVPWSVRNYYVTGTYAVSGMGWYNLYFDYLSSLDALTNKTSFIQEKTERENNPPPGVVRGETLNPTSAPALKSAALAELAQKWQLVLKFEPVFLFSYFTHDGYYQYARSFGFIGEAGEPASSSTTFALLSQGEGRFKVLFNALKAQYFIPLIGRGFAALIVVLALIGVWYKRREPMVYMLALTIALSAVVATTIGLGVEARLRVPMEPLLFLLAGIGVCGLLSRYRGKTEISSHHSSS